MSFLRGNGHPYAPRYPLAYLWNEVAFVRDNENARIATEMTGIHAAIIDVMNGGKQRVFAKFLKGLEDGA